MNIKNIILVIAIILVVAGTFMFLMAHQAHPKQDTKIMMTSADNITEGDNITVKLTDVNNTPLTNQNLNISIVGGSGGSVLKSLNTDGNGEVTIETDNSTTGSCALVVKYGGNDEFDGCNFTDNLVINKKVVKVKTNLTNITSNYTTKTASSNSTANLMNYFGDDIITVEDYT